MRIKTEQLQQKALQNVQRLSDIRFTGQLVFAIIVLLITWSGIKSILELSARQNFGLAAPGEKEIIVPQSVALAYTTNLPTTTKQVPTNNQQPAYQKNFESWVDFFLHRSN